MVLQDLLKHIKDMSDEQLLEHVRQIRHNREIARLGSAARAKRAAGKESRKTAKGLSDLVDKMSPEERAALLESLEASDDKG